MGKALLIVIFNLVLSFLAVIQVEGFGPWLFKQTALVVLLVTAIIIVTKYFQKRDEKKEKELAAERTKHEDNVKQQIQRYEVRLDKFDLALERKDAVTKEQTRAIELVGERMRDLGDEWRRAR